MLEVFALTDDPFERLEKRLSDHMDKIDKRMQETEKKVTDFFDRGPPGPMGEGPPMSPEGPDMIPDKMSEISDKLVEPGRKIARDIDDWMDKQTPRVKKIGRTTEKMIFPIQAGVSPLTVMIFLKNLKQHPNASNDELIQMTNRETVDIALDVVNVIWPGTSAEGAKEDVKNRLGEMAYDFTGERFF